MAPRVPSAPLFFLAAVHPWQRALQALLQQTPSAQKPVAHSRFSAQGVPIPSSAQAPLPLHEKAPAHSLWGSVPAAMGPQKPSAPDPFAALVHA